MWHGITILLSLKNKLVSQLSLLIAYNMQAPFSASLSTHVYGFPSPSRSVLEPPVRASTYVFPSLTTCCHLVLSPAIFQVWMPRTSAYSLSLLCSFFVLLGSRGLSVSLWRFSSLNTMYLTIRAPLFAIASSLFKALKSAALFCSFPWLHLTSTFDPSEIGPSLPPCSRIRVFQVLFPFPSPLPIIFVVCFLNCRMLRWLI